MYRNQIIPSEVLTDTGVGPQTSTIAVSYLAKGRA